MSGLRPLDWSQVEEMARHDVEMGAHTVSHPELPGLDDAVLRREIRDSKDAIEQRLGRPVTSFCYPRGRFDDRVEREVDAAVGAARAFGRSGFPERAAVLRGVADILEARAEEIAALVTLEMGKTLAAARAEVEKCARACRWFAAEAPGLLADDEADAGAVGAERAYVTYRPLGAVLAIMPWNFPYWQAVRFLAPTILAGNVALMTVALYAVLGWMQWTSPTAVRASGQGLGYNSGRLAGAAAPTIMGVLSAVPGVGIIAALGLTSAFFLAAAALIFAFPDTSRVELRA